MSPSVTENNAFWDFENKGKINLHRVFSFKRKCNSEGQLKNGSNSWKRSSNHHNILCSELKSSY